MSPPHQLMAVVCTLTRGLLTSLTKNLIKPGVVSYSRTFSAMSELLNKIPDVDIDANGIFKYILVHVHDDNKGQTKTKSIVRGYARCQWHADIYSEIEGELKKYGSGLDAECVGGGRINHDAEKKTIHVYGYSQGYGKADHSVSVDLLKKKYPDHAITWSDEGY